MTNWEFVSYQLFGVICGVFFFIWLFGNALDMSTNQKCGFTRALASILVVAIRWLFKLVFEYVPGFIPNLIDSMVAEIFNPTTRPKRKTKSFSEGLRSIAPKSKCGIYLSYEDWEKDEESKRIENITKRLGLVPPITKHHKTW